MSAPEHATELRIVNPKGLHARAAAKFVTTAATFQATITVHKDGIAVPGTSIMGLMMLGAAMGTAIRVSASGHDAAEALASLAALVTQGFGEL